MTIQLICPWCEDEVAFAVDEASDEIVCSACGIRTEFAPDPVATFSLLYEAA
jgi:transcription elongation factor Elf1